MKVGHSGSGGVDMSRSRIWGLTVCRLCACEAVDTREWGGDKAT